MIIQLVSHKGKSLEVEIVQIGYGDKMFEVSTPEGIAEWKRSPCYQEWIQPEQERGKQCEKHIESALYLKMKNPPEQLVRELQGMGSPSKIRLEKPVSIDWDHILAE
ncbi:MAG: hypothetical protein WC155_08770 [Candidatus Cloacimonadales bacterium]|nr:hypothetical protein [Methanolobus sp.]